MADASVRRVRDELKALLLGHIPEDDEERADLADMLDFVDVLEDPLSRDQLEAHFTASAAIVDPSGSRFCLDHCECREAAVATRSRLPLKPEA